MTKYKCKECNFDAERSDFSKPCPKCGEDTITAFLNKRESKIVKTIINYELGE